MEAYYTLVFTLILFTQDRLQGFVITLLCLASTLLRVHGYYWVDGQGIGFQESSVLVETFILVAFSITYPIHKSYWAIVVSIIGLVMNMYLLFSTDIYMVWWLYANCDNINVLLFEISIILCLRQSWLYPKITSWLNSITPKPVQGI